MEKLPGDREYKALLGAIKSRITQAQTSAALAVNRELVSLYWYIGQAIYKKQQVERWGAKVVENLSIDLKREFPEQSGYSVRNLKNMIQFYAEYPDLSVYYTFPDVTATNDSIVQQPVAQLEGRTCERVIMPQAVAQLEGKTSDHELFPQAVRKLEEQSGGDADGAKVRTLSAQSHERESLLALDIPWGHNMLLIAKVKDKAVRYWYIRQTIREGWSRSVLQTMIETGAYERTGTAVTNFDDRLPEPQAALAKEALKDPYNLGFLQDLGTYVKEREIENALLRELRRFLIELGQGFAFVGNQYYLELEGEDYYLDLLFYHLRLRCFIVIDLKIGKFIPEYAGKMNFYCNLVDDTVRHKDDKPTIGLILCQDRNKVVAEYALRGMEKPIGVSEYELTRALPEKFKSALPTVEEIEEELSNESE